MDLKEAALKARELMMPQCRMCPECNGVACRGEVPGMGGKGTGSGFMNNYNELRRITLNMKVMHEVKEPVMTCRLFGAAMPLPIFPAPVTGVNFNMGNKISEHDYVSGLVRGCKRNAMVPMVGDSAFKSFIEDNLDVLKAEQVSGIAFIKPWNNDELFSRIDLAMESNPMAIGVDIDSCGLDTLKIHGHRVDPKSIEEIRQIRAYVRIPLIIKGIMTAEEALSCLDAGVDAIVVSNHGGRVLDHVPATCSALEGIVAAVAGRIPVLVDGGIRSGVDVFKMLALGADAVLIGRTFAQYAIGGGEEGVDLYIRKLQNELRGAMILTGSKDIKSIKRTSINY